MWLYILLWGSTLLPLVHSTEVLVVTVATEKNEGLKRYLRSAERHGIDVHVFGLDEDWKGGDTRIEQGGGQKIRILRRQLEKYKDKKDMVIIFSDAYDVIWANGLDVLIDRFTDHYSQHRIIFGAEPFCWPKKELAIEYPLVEFGKRFLNSGLFMGYAPEIYRMLSLKEVEDKDDDQLYFTMIYLDEKLRKELKMGLDSISRIFQNLNGVQEDVKIEFDQEGTAYVFNTPYNTHPVLIHGNGISKLYLNYLSNYVGEWSREKGCLRCEQRKKMEKEEEEAGESMELPTISLAVFISSTPFVEEVLNALGAQDYPKSKIHLFIYNSQPFHLETVSKWAESQKGEFISRSIINVDMETGERDARQMALESMVSRGSEYLFMTNGDIYLQREEALRDLVKKSLFYDIDIISPILNQPGKLFSNFWGAIAHNGYYARSEDYVEIVNGARVGLWNVPFIASPLLIKGDLVKNIVSSRPFHYSKELDPDMSFALYARHKGHFLHVSNEDSDGFLIVSDEFANDLQKGRLHTEMWQIFDNRWLWEQRYLHDDFVKILNGPVEEVPQPCPDVYDYALLSPRFCAELIEEMEHFGEWSDGSNSDKRLAGGYENVPTRDIHMNQVGFEREWLYFINEYVRPMQEKMFIGYFKNPIESHMMFVVRYKPDEQASLRPHHDASTFSIDIALNQRGVDFEGGGVRYVRYNCTVPADEVGHTMMFPGRLTHLHEGLPTTKGTRYILVSFINP
ncbi:let-268 [Pristionchus pacificus]|nr:let-268 [Pristionchus pacificus]